MYYWNTCGDRYLLPEQALEPRDCWEPETYDDDEQEDN